MKTAIKCDSWNKPGKNEIPKSIISWNAIKKYPDCDCKRTTVCREPVGSIKK